MCPRHVEELNDFISFVPPVIRTERSSISGPIHGIAKNWKIIPKAVAVSALSYTLRFC